MSNFIVFILFFFLSSSAFAVCSDPISREAVLIKPLSVRYNGDLDLVYGQLNELPGDCINDSSITSAQFPDSAITTDKIADGTITAVKFADGVIPGMGKPLRIRAFTTSGVWIKQPDVGSIFVQVVGGGGAARDNFVSGANHTTATGSSFGSHCVANAGSRSATANGGSGGTASNGDLNFTGFSGQRQTSKSCYQEEIDEGVFADFYCTFGAKGGQTPLGRYGMGGSYYAGNHGITLTGGGGAGGYCAKLIQRANLGDSESVSVGVGGSATGTNSTYANPGQPGIVIIYEYGK